VIGTGAFVGVGIAVNVAGSGAIAAILISAIAALCTELTAAQRVAIQRVPHREHHNLSPWLDFTASWTLLLAKLVTAAIAAAGFAGYLLSLFNHPNLVWLTPIALLLVASLTILFLIKLPPAKLFQPILLAIALLILFVFLGAGLQHWFDRQTLSQVYSAPQVFSAPQLPPPFLQNLLRASALMFFAYAARLPHRQTDRQSLNAATSLSPKVSSILLTIVLSAALYLSIAKVGIAAVGSQALGDAADSLASLAIALRQSGASNSSQLVAAGATIVLCGIVANLMLEAARTLQAMAQQQDAPPVFARFSPMGTPAFAVAAMGGAIACLILISDVETLWSFGAFAVLLYAILTHLALFNLLTAQQLYPRLLTGISLGICLFLTCWINSKVWLVSLGLAAVGLIWRGINQWVQQQSEDSL
jgi:basic amino acid/polyamine antiporter, APA family